MALIEAVVPGHARARLGPHRERHLDRDQGADTRADALEQPPARGGRARSRPCRGSWDSDGILLNSVAPGRIATERIASMAGTPLEELRSQPQPDIPVGRLGEPREMGDVIAFLCSERASYVTGVSLMVDGGLTRSV